MRAARTAALETAYDECRAIAKREAKNFYYAFRVLPRYKADAMCAVYAFMRKADDLADDETLSIEARRAAMAQWTAAWRASRTTSTTDPVFLALNDTRQRFNIPVELLEQLVSGTTMDLEEQPAGVTELQIDSQNYQVYRTFDELYRYCYLVASVVGLVCIRIFGYSDPRAEELAEHVGVAFQLTNILRDVKEDAERGRVYLPLDDAAVAGVNVEQIVLMTRGVAPSSDAVVLLRREMERAESYYRDADALVPLLDADSQPAMWVLATIYRELLARIAANPAAVFRERVSVPSARKIAILARGMMSAVFARSVR